MRGHVRVRTATCVLAVLWVFSVGCGGGSSGGGVQTPPPPQPDFALVLSSSSVTVAQGASSSPITVGVTGENGFSGSVTVSLAGLPAGVTTNPASPFTVAAGQTASLIVGADSSCATGQFNLSAQASSGSLSHSTQFALTIQAASFNLPRSVYTRNDSVASVDVPPGETRRRQVVYDSTGKRFFVANRAMNRVEVYGDPSLVLQATVDAPGAASVDLSSDGSTLWVGTSLEQVLAVDTSSLQVKERYTITGLMPIPGIVFLRPTEALAFSNGNLALRLRQAASPESLLALWNPSSNTLTNLTSQAPTVFQSGLGVIARSGDHKRLIAAANDASGQAVVFDGSGNVLAGPQPIASGTILQLATNQDASAFAALVNINGATVIVLLDDSLNKKGAYSATAAAGLVFSPDGETLYVSEALTNGRVVTALTTSTLQKIGQISDIAPQGIPTAIEEVDASQLVVGRGNRGIGAIDVSHLGSLPTPAPLLSAAPSAEPSEGPNAGGTSVTLSGSNFSPGAEVVFGQQNSVSTTLSSASQLVFSSPPSVNNGSVNLTAHFPSGWIAVAPSGFSYGPAVQSIFPNAGKPAGGDTIYILGYGFDGSVSVTIGGHAATVQKVEALPSFASAYSLDATYPFSLERITLTTPSGTGGKADVFITAASGTAALTKSFQYLGASQIYAHPGLYKFVLYDESRQQVYLSATDHVDVFDMNAHVFRNPINPPPNGPPPDAGLRGMALTPDNTQLVVADFGAQSVYLINPGGAMNNGLPVVVGGVAGFLNSGPSRVAATSDSTVFVGLSGEAGSANACNNCLGQMNLTAFPPTYEPAPQPEVTSITGTPLLQGDHAGDTVYLAYGSSPGGPVASWSASAPDAFALSSANDLSTDLIAAADGTMFALRANGATEIRSAALTLVASPVAAELETMPNRVAVPGVAIHPSGALIYEPFLDGQPPAAPPATGIHGGIDIRDAHNGRLRLRIYLPEPFAMLSTDVDGLHGQFLTVDENGQRLFAVTTSGLTVVQLANVPLGIGTLSPAQGIASGGTSVTLRGSGFQSGTAVTLGGKPLTVTFKDMNTLTFATPSLNSGAQQLVLMNPDGESVSLDAAFLAQ